MHEDLFLWEGLGEKRHCDPCGKYGLFPAAPRSCTLVAAGPGGVQALLVDEAHGGSSKMKPKSSNVVLMVSKLCWPSLSNL